MVVRLGPEKARTFDCLPGNAESVLTTASRIEVQRELLADLDEATGERVQEEVWDELKGIEGEGLSLVAMC